MVLSTDYYNLGEPVSIDLGQFEGEKFVFSLPLLIPVLIYIRTLHTMTLVRCKRGFGPEHELMVLVTCN
jgi:hypothetical protein